MRARSRFWCAVAACVLTLPSLATTRADEAAARVYLKAGDSLFQQWRYRDALAMYARAERAGDGVERLDAARGVSASALRLGQFDLAYETASRLRESGAGGHHALTAYGEAAWGNGFFDEAEGAFLDALAISPDEPRARLGLARVLLGRGRAGEALAHALAAAAVAPDDADAHYLSALVYQRLARPDAAARQYARYLTLAPASATDKRSWVTAQVQLLQSFNRRVPDRIERGEPTSLHTVPFRLVNDKMLVQTRVNGGPDVEFQIDTGAETTVLSQATAFRSRAGTVGSTVSVGIGDAGLRGLGNARVDTIQIGTLVLHDVACLITAPPPRGSGALDLDSFSPLAAGLSIRVDYNQRRVTFARELPADPYDVTEPLWFYRLATVRGAFDNRVAGRFIVDTGARAISVASDTAAAADRPGLRRIKVPVFGLSGRDRDACLLLGADVAVGPVALARPPVVVLDLQTTGERLGYRVRGIAGQQFLSKYRVSIDLKRMVLGLAMQGKQAVDSR